MNIRPLTAVRCEVDQNLFRKSFIRVVIGLMEVKDNFRWSGWDESCARDVRRDARRGARYAPGPERGGSNAGAGQGQGLICTCLMPGIVVPDDKYISNGDRIRMRIVN